MPGIFSVAMPSKLAHAGDQFKTTSNEETAPFARSGTSPRAIRGRELPDGAPRLPPSVSQWTPLERGPRDHYNGGAGDRRLAAWPAEPDRNRSPPMCLLEFSTVRPFDAAKAASCWFRWCGRGDLNSHVLESALAGLAGSRAQT
jgi:hypothetical protein